MNERVREWGEGKRNEANKMQDEKKGDGQWKRCIAYVKAMPQTSEFKGIVNSLSTLGHREPKSVHPIQYIQQQYIT